MGGIVHQLFQALLIIILNAVAHARQLPDEAVDLLRQHVLVEQEQLAPQLFVDARDAR